MFENQNQPKKPQSPPASLPNQGQPDNKPKSNLQKPADLKQSQSHTKSEKNSQNTDNSDISAKIAELNKISHGGKKKITIITVAIIVIIGLIIGAIYLFQNLNSPEKEEIVVTGSNNINNNGNLSVNKDLNLNTNANTNNNSNNTNTYINTSNPNSDSDNDGLINKKELYYGTSPTKKDTDGDGYSDLNEIENKFNPLGSGKLTAEDFYIYCVNNLNDNLEEKYQDLIGRNNINTFCQAGQELISEYGLGKNTISHTAYLTKCQEKFTEENSNTSNSILINNCQNELSPIIIDFLSPGN
ncbi:MAG: hypothetical protein U5L76_03895 [Patescibacteria group bacterium]|nr:hypothetical protein [Patescibacteria group bacterium]